MPLVLAATRGLRNEGGGVSALQAPYLIAIAEVEHTLQYYTVLAPMSLFHGHSVESPCAVDLVISESGISDNL